MSRRKQEKPQPCRTTSLPGAAESPMDSIVCGVCQAEFPLGDICIFIKHKVEHCDKENSNQLPKDPLNTTMGSESVSPVRASSQTRPHSRQGSTAGAASDSENCLDDELADRPINLSLTQDTSPVRKRETADLICLGCRHSFSHALDLLNHLQSEHRLTLFARSMGYEQHHSTSHPSTSSSSGTPLLPRQLHVSSSPFNSTNPRNWLPTTRQFDVDNVNPSVLTGLSTWGGGELVAQHPAAERLRLMAAAASETGDQPNIDGKASLTNGDQITPKSGSGEKVRECPHCFKTFRFHSNLVVHIRSHTGEKPYKCTKCNYACKQASKLKRHMKVHQANPNWNPRSVDSDVKQESGEENTANESEEEEGETAKRGLRIEEDSAEELMEATMEPGPSSPEKLEKKELLNGQESKKGTRRNFGSIRPSFPTYGPSMVDLSSWYSSPKKKKPKNSEKSIEKESEPVREASEHNGDGSIIDEDEAGESGDDSNGKSMSLDIKEGSTDPDGKKSGNRKDVCEFCGKTFKNCSNLTVHRRSHTGEKPYKCNFCDYACAQSSKLTRHMKTHGRAGKDIYRCRFCSTPFSIPSTLEKHMRKCVTTRGALQGISGIPPQAALGDVESLRCKATDAEFPPMPSRRHGGRHQNSTDTNGSTEKGVTAAD